MAYIQDLDPDWQARREAEHDDVMDDIDLDSWDCGSGMCDPLTGCPACSERDHWVRAR
jgi:hypothetical protein